MKIKRNALLRFFWGFLLWIMDRPDYLKYKKSYSTPSLNIVVVKTKCKHRPTNFFLFCKKMIIYGQLSFLNGWSYCQTDFTIGWSFEISWFFTQNFWKSTKAKSKYAQKQIMCYRPFYYNNHVFHEKKAWTRASQNIMKLVEITLNAYTMYLSKNINGQTNVLSVWCAKH